MNQTGKMSAEPPRLDNKRERRRGAAGRAAVLRRAPSDSDCSGETASLSADSGERTRQPLPPPRSGKARSRRRGSEWEVLEGLKDGQRFDKRPDVFNGYLHKKRKWPLKGWHKRFFVVDGGILVYARSPADVARGRLHGSVDVGLSVISAKARRRRIDIDADEFIYHVRAKTPEVFRTWLNVLKAHRLYRQHLLTFGARESVPKIHAPNDDMPPTDASSRTFSIGTSSTQSPDPSPHKFNLYSKENKDQHSIRECQQINPFGVEEPNNIESLELKQFDIRLDDSIFKNQNSLCSMKCVDNQGFLKKFKRQNSSNISLKNTEEQITCDDLTSLKISSSEQKHSFTLRNRVPATTCFFFSRKKHLDSCTPAMRKSKKCTDLVKYKNISDEPPLRRPCGKCLFLEKQSPVMAHHTPTVASPIPSPINYNEPIIETTQEKSIDAQIKVIEDTKDPKELMVDKDFDKITEQLIIQIFRHQAMNDDQVKLNISQVVKDLYDLKVDQRQDPVKALFRSLLEYWLKNTNKNTFKEAMTNVKAIDKPSNKYFTRDENLSALFSHPIEKETQFEISEVLKCKVKSGGTKTVKTKDATKPASKLPLNNRESYLKERRIQELEKFLRSTVYLCQTKCNSNGQHENEDIKITKRSIDSSNRDKKTQESILKQSSSTDWHKIQKTIDHIMSSDTILSGFIKEFLDAYLDILLHQDSNIHSTLQSSGECSPYKASKIKIQAESVTKNDIKNVTMHKDSKGIENVKNLIDPGRTYLKDILEKISAIFPNIGIDPENGNNKSNRKNYDNAKNSLLDPSKKAPNNVFIDNWNENSLNTELTKSNLNWTDTFREPALNDVMSITIKLNENRIEDKSKLNLKSPKDSQQKAKLISDNDWISLINNASSNEIFKFPISNKELVKDFIRRNELIDVKHYVSSSDATSKAFMLNDQPLSSNCNMQSNSNLDVSDRKFSNQCYIFSLTKNNSPTTSKNNTLPNPANDTSSKTELDKPELSVFEKPAPRVIDEKFILLLLENLSHLSKHLPTLYKDINSLYMKLKKKHEKIVKHCSNIQGLSLLGKIYSENCCGVQNNETQYEDIEASYINTFDNAATSTKFEVIDKRVGTNLDKVNFSVKDSIPSIIQLKKLEANEIKLTKVNNNQIPQTANTISDHIILKSSFNKSDFYKVRIHTCRNLSKEMKTKVVDNKSTNERHNILIHNAGPEQKSAEHFFITTAWVSKLSLKASCSNIPDDKSDDLRTLYRCSSSPCSGLLSPSSPPIRGPQAGFVSGTPGGRLASWIIESGGPLENASRELGQAQLSVQQLQRLLDALELQQQVHHDTDVSLDGASPNVKKDRRKFGLRKKKSNSKCASVELAPPHIDPSASHTALSALTAPPSPGGGASSMPNSAASLPIACAAARPQSLPGAESLATAPGPASLTSLTPDHQLREDFTVLAKDLVTSLKGIVSTLVCERGRLRAAMESAESATTPGGAVMAALRTNLNSALQQNSELRSRLSRIHDASDIAEMCSLGNNTDAATRQFQQSLSYSSSCVSASEFFDAEEHDDEIKNDEDIPPDEPLVIELDGDSSSEAGSLSSEDGSNSSDNSDGAMVSAEAVTLRADANIGWTRRTRLPAPRPVAGGPSLWNLLYKNIGKDLSQISMPVTINEPLNMLQRLCEELEYCELLDAAAGSTCRVERAALVAAFAVSAYAAAAHRAASKPFNPLLHETYECVRDDKGFKFLAEQVSHHPPISACHAESPRWCFWQEARIKTKFWGKSMEFQPTGRVHVRLNTTGDHYTWNKVTTCVHNLFGGQRWVDQYGDMHISCVGTDITCKLSFIKASSWSGGRHEVRGAVAAGREARLRLAGRWSEALYAGDPPAARCLWRPGAMPPEHELYYGFTRFAMELNEMEPGMKDILPHTDTRFRPDQRALELGDVEAAEALKLQLEQSQRERRRDSLRHTAAWFRKTIEDGEETWVFSGEYWRVRERGFPSDVAPRIW